MAGTWKPEDGAEGYGPEWKREHARASDPATSHAAAEPTARTGTLLAELAAAYHRAGSSGLTAYEAAKAAGVGPDLGPWKRVSDLERQGVIADTGRVRPGPSGRAQRVLAIVQAEPVQLRLVDDAPYRFDPERVRVAVAEHLDRRWPRGG